MLCARGIASGAKPRFANGLNMQNSGSPIRKSFLSRFLNVMRCKCGVH